MSSTQSRKSALRALCASHPLVYDLQVFRQNTFGNSQREIPSRVLLIRSGSGDPSSELLYLDEVPLPREAWDYDTADRILTWRGAYGGGRFFMSHDGRGATGAVGPAHDVCSVEAGATAVFNCDVALNTGASYETNGGIVTGLLWDPTSPQWTGASWDKDRLQLTYTVTPNGPIQPPSFTFDFQDNQTDMSWDPVEGAFAAALSLATKKGLMVWLLTFKSSVAPDPDYVSPSTEPDSVYPYWMQAVEDSAAASINGVLVIDNTAPSGTLVGMQGVRANAAVSGYYRARSGAMPFGVFNARLRIGGQVVPNSRVSGTAIHWQNLSQEQQQRTGLAESGSLDLSGATGAARASSLPAATRLNAADTLAALAEHRAVHPELHARMTLAQEQLGDPALSIYGLLAMNPFQQNSQGAWGDAVQAAVTQDLSNIMNSCIPSDMWNLIFPGITQPSLTGELAIVANSPVPNVSDPKAFYGTLATSVMTQGLAGGSDENCKYLNGPRAAAWLKTQVATSPVYNTHGQLLFQYQWQQLFGLTSQYLADQVTNASTYATTIATQVTQSIADINTNVAPDPTDPDLIATLIADVQAAGDYATNNNLYWAFAYYTYNTAPSILANIALQMSINTGSSDGTTLSRLFQQNAAVLTAMDPSGFFAQRYTQTINTFMVTNILPTMFDFTGDSNSFTVIRLYLQAFVDNNINNEDQQIAQAAAQIQSILQDAQADKILQDSIVALRTIADTIQDALAFPFVAQKFLKWFQGAYPKFSAIGGVFGSLFVGAITGLGVFNLVSQFKNWNKMTDEEKAQVIVNASQLGLQIVAAVVQRGIRIYALFGTSGLTAGQRAAAISKILVNGEAEAMSNGMLKIGNSAARWLADTEGTIGKIAVTDQGVMTAVLVNSAETAAEEAGWVGKILGRNLDEFIATRIGPIFILAGIGFSIYSIAKGDSGVALVSDILGIVGGSLMLFATIGGWAVAGGLIAAEGLLAGLISVAGPLAILAALAGIGLMIYEMLQKPPDPVEGFVNDYARPAGLAVNAQSSSIDYAVIYPNPDQSDLLMMGFTLSVNQQTLNANGDGTISLGNSTPTPACVWVGTTDGLGMTKICTVVQSDPNQPPALVYLSLMSDQTVSFQPPLPPPQPTGDSHPAGDGPTVVTQTWLSAPQGNATLTSSGGFLASIPLTFQPVPPDANGNYNPNQAAGWLVQIGLGVGISQSSNTTFTLQMSGLAPNYTSMQNLSFTLNTTPSPMQSFGPTFGMPPSTPMTYAQTATLPPFLTFTTQTGTFAPNGQVASTGYLGTDTITVTNALGSGSKDFTITVAAATSTPAVEEAMAL